ncbi:MULTISPECIES: DUF1450 domain-containing protein [Thermoactinomyces]|uniref:DUF1450 domain-containing protein n=1 Tax=Thermoactinomyces daqus TaxID=1329516 RepID=A0A7W1X8T8_9BACL|nr:DUF1450 domain-containing protein [Thermoactinomyces daqus]MBA4542094.1 DUF1450 domain-containing protein [Thermoactinomyces daqus]MBH8598936.1 DUF1450 domain-containing protein [Thermoactinomyces sp. CICC 10523]MBH8604922.1 DUF1450 domain-containing protein [Thermoactinomyces sp. CICC 10522]MBH8608362.1 DUF1450 domain-containing protein [Thermoactinomyces sp. CICC 10521]
MEKREIVVEFCISNLVSGSLSAYYQLKNHKHPYIKVKAERCLGYCGRCGSSFFALIDYKPVEADTPEELYEEIVRELSNYLE